MPPLKSAISIEKALRLLGLPPGAGPGDIRNAYRRLAFEYHPDRHAGQPEMEARFKEIGEAYRALTSDSVGVSPSAPIQKGRDLHYDIQVDFMTAAGGGEVSVRIRRPFICAVCEGQSSKECSECKGEGFVAEKAMVGVMLPSGLDDGESVRFPFEGAPGTGGGGNPAGGDRVGLGEIAFQAVPEPATASLAIMSLGALAFWRRRL